MNNDLGVTSLFVDEKFIYSTSHDSIVLVRNKNTRKVCGILEGHLHRSNTVTSDDKFIYTGDGFTILGAALRVWDKYKYTQCSEFSNPISTRILSLFVDEKYLYTGHGIPDELRI